MKTMMKNYFFVLMLFIFIDITYSQAQSGNKLSVLPLLNEGELRYKELVEKSNKTITRFEIDLVNQSSNKYTTVNLVSGRTYSIMLSGELNIINGIELKIYTYSNRSNRVLVMNVDNSTRNLETTFKPDKSDYYEFEIIGKNFSAGNKVGRYCLIIAN
jgi:hypothetical protein